MVFKCEPQSNERTELFDWATRVCAKQNHRQFGLQISDQSIKWKYKKQVIDSIELPLFFSTEKEWKYKKAQKSKESIVGDRNRMTFSY